MSYDTVEENQAFANTEEFPFNLLSDPDRKVSKAYHVARPDDHEYAAFPRRISFLIDPEGKIAKTYKVEDVASHAEEVLTDLKVVAG